MGCVIETFGLTKRFAQVGGFIDLLHPLRKKEVTAVEDVNLKIKKGELFGILGPNGAGKTTLIKMLCTLILPTAGSAYLNGYDIVKEEEKARASLGFVTGDERSFYWRLSGRQNLEFFAALNNTPDPRSKIDELMALMELKDKADAKFYSYSTGMKQRMAIARGLLNDPEVLFMDEPTRSLDPSVARNLRDFIKEQLVKNQGKTVFLSTHNLDEAEQLCDRIAIIDKARIRACGALNDLRKTIKRNETYLLEVKGFPGYALTKLAEIEEVISFSMRVHSDLTLLEVELSSSEAVLPQIIEIIVGTGGKVCACSTKKIALNEVFDQLVNKGEKIDI